MSILKIKNSQGNWVGVPSIKGEKGDKGDTGASGRDGTDGISPTVTITPITGGRRITITDADGSHSADVMDGDDYTLTAQDKQDIAELVDVPVDDVQINGTSIVENGVANIPYASNDTNGLARTNATYGTKIDSDGIIRIQKAAESETKAGTGSYRPITTSTQHAATFYGLAKSAGDTTQSSSSNAVGTYTEDAKSKISEMLGGSVSVSGTTPTITAKSGIRYVCGEVATLDFTPSQTGVCDVVFTSGATATVLTVPSTIKWANGFDPTSLDANTTYELNIMDGLGVAVGWT